MKKLFVLCMSLLTISNSFAMQRVGMQGLQVITPQVMAIAASIAKSSYTFVPRDTSNFNMLCNVSDKVRKDTVKSACDVRSLERVDSKVNLSLGFSAGGMFRPTPICLMRKSEAEHVLNLSAGYTTEDVKHNYKKLVKKWHPDMNLGNQAVAEKKFKEIGEAYEILTGKRAADSEYSGYNNYSYSSGYSSNDFKQKSYESNAYETYTKDSSHNFWNKYTFFDGGSGEKLFSFKFPKFRYIFGLWLLKKIYDNTSSTGFDKYNHNYENLIALDAYAPWNWQRAQEKRRDYLVRLSDYEFERLFLHAVKIQDSALLSEMIESGRIAEKDWDSALTVIVENYSLMRMIKVIKMLPKSVNLSLSSLSSYSKERVIKENFNKIRYFLNKDRFNYNDNTSDLNRLIRIALDQGQIAVVSKLYKNSDALLDIEYALNYIERHDCKTLVSSLLEAKNDHVRISFLHKVIDGKGYSFAASCINPMQKFIFEQYKKLEAVLDQNLYNQAEIQGKKEYKKQEYKYKSEDSYIRDVFQELKNKSLSEYENLWQQACEKTREGVII